VTDNLVVEIDPAHESTWGATPEYKAAWEAKHGESALRPAESAPKAEWVDWAVAHTDLDRKQAEGLTTKALKELE